MTAHIEGGIGIAVIGRQSPLLDGVADLLQLAGYRVDISPNWEQVKRAGNGKQTRLAIVDLSGSAGDAQRLRKEISHIPAWAELPILCVGFPEDKPVQDLDRYAGGNHDQRLHFYAHSLLGMEGLVQKVRECLG